ncbi:GNAT family N-acetyltransferase [Chitinivorax sp. B]|uniref:GNAT family N-acetyltransferase n=1 Tax=Chitinivorax sp. B TaxID=2502235 RepID=UPI0010F6545D|nr:GNAT family N-acetyltransferase [Chitinivorax sp. B]
MTKIDLIHTDINEKNIIRNLYQFYSYDSSDWESFDLESNGLFYMDDNYFAHYWELEGWSANLIKVNDEIAGFLLIEHNTLPGLDAPEFADLFLMKKYRRQGIGQQIVEGVMLGTAHPWVVNVFVDDTQAMDFWNAMFNRLPFHSVRTFIDPDRTDLRIFVINEEE